MGQDPCRLGGNEVGAAEGCHEDLLPRRKNGRGGYLLLITATLTCPCHLPFLLALTAGTTLGSILSRHLWLAALLLAIYFLGALHFGLKRLDKEKWDPPGRP